jgi:hypothetical protein
MALVLAKHRDLAVQAAGVGGQVGVHLFELGEDLAGVAEQRFAGRRRRQAAGWRAKSGTPSAASSCVRRWLAEEGARCTALAGTGQAAAVGNGGDEPQVGEVVMHGFVHNECLLGIIPIAKAANGRI